MRYRELTPAGDSTIFSGATQFLVNSPAAVAQAVLTRLNLWQGQWFLDSTLGLPVFQQIIGFGTQAVRDAAIQNVILNTPGVNQITKYTSSLTGRAFRVDATIDTIYGSTAITTSF
jgi:hypothetical protein